MQRLLIGALLFLPSPAHAHLVGMEFGDFYAGALHLIVAPEHVAILITLACIAAFQSRNVARWILIALPVGLGFGGAAAMIWTTEIPTTLIGLSLAMLGIAAAAALRVHLAVLIAASVLVAGLHGFTNALPAADGGADPLLYTLGAMSAGTVLGTIGIAAATVLAARHRMVPMAYRIVAGWITASGAMYGALSLAA
ncbi:MAG: HupE/UreJ family protein [Pseudomonadota bacterium]